MDKQRIKRKILIFLLIALAQLVLSVCSDRIENPIEGETSTLIYPSKSANGIEATIKFCERINKQTNKTVKENTIFTLKKNAKVYTLVDLINKNYYEYTKLMFHIDWLDSSGNSFYKKRIDLSPSDSISRITSSISITQKKRKVGNYIVRVYLFRELIAEKHFQLVDSFKKSITLKKRTKSEKKIEVKKSVKPKITTQILEANIILCRKISKKTGRPIGSGTIFTIKDRAKIKAIVNVEKSEIITNEQMTFNFKWIGPDGKIFYKKRVVYTSSNRSFTISSSISTIPEKRVPGTYTLQVTSRKIIIAEQKFQLINPN